MLAVVPTKHDARTRHGNEVLAHIRATYGHIAASPIPHTVAFKDAILACRPLVDHNPGTDGARAYEELADEVIRRAS
jgi:cellulose biosynthesis protein BcsQ